MRQFEGYEQVDTNDVENARGPDVVLPARTVAKARAGRY